MARSSWSGIAGSPAPPHPVEGGAQAVRWDRSRGGASPRASPTRTWERGEWRRSGRSAKAVQMARRRSLWCGRSGQLPPVDSPVSAEEERGRGDGPRSERSGDARRSAGRQSPDAPRRSAAEGRRVRPARLHRPADLRGGHPAPQTTPPRRPERHPSGRPISMAGPPSRPRGRRPESTGGFPSWTAPNTSECCACAPGTTMTVPARTPTDSPPTRDLLPRPGARVPRSAMNSRHGRETGSSNEPSSSLRSPLWATRHRGLLRQKDRPGQAPHPSPVLPRQTTGRRPFAMLHDGLFRTPIGCNQ